MTTPANDLVSKNLTKKSTRYLQLAKFQTFPKNNTKKNYQIQFKKYLNLLPIITIITSINLGKFIVLESRKRL